MGSILQIADTTRVVLSVHQACGVVCSPTARKPPAAAVLWQGESSNPASKWEQCKAAVTRQAQPYDENHGPRSCHDRAGATAKPAHITGAPFSASRLLVLTLPEQSAN